MAEWMFLVVGHFGGTSQRRELARKIGSLVAREGLSSVLPLVKYEVSKYREYYLGLAYDAHATLSDESDESPEAAARRILMLAGVSNALNLKSTWSFVPEDAKFLHGSVDGESFSIPIQFEEHGQDDLPSASEILASLQDDTMIEREDLQVSQACLNLLYWCSATGGGSLPRIQQAASELGLVDGYVRAWPLLRRLVLLGHAEFDGGDVLAWGMVPTTLVTLDLSSTDMLLVGQRTPSLVDQLCNHFNVEETVQRDGPSRIVVRGVSPEVIAERFPSFVQTGNVARRLSCLLPSIQAWLERLPTWDEHDYGRFDIEQYIPEPDTFAPVAGPVQDTPGALYRFTFEQPQERRIVNLAFRDGGANRWVCGDYYGMRFLARQHRSLCRALYSNEGKHLVIPASDRWPMPYERPLVLASGLLPRRRTIENGNLMLQYNEVSRELATELCELLNLNLEVA